MPATKALLITDDPEFGRSIIDLLSGSPAPPFVLQIEPGGSGLPQPAAGNYDLVLFEFGAGPLPDLRAVQLASPGDLPIPALVFVEPNREADGLQAIAAGFDDFLVKGSFDGQLLSWRIQAALGRSQAQAQMTRANAELTRSEEALRAALEDVKRSHRELKAAQLQIIQTAKLESVGTLAAGVAHEVKNPLQIILMGVDYLSQHHASPNENVPAVLEDMRQAIARADRIVRGLLEFSSAYRPEVRDEDLNSIIESSLTLVRFELAKGRVEVNRFLGDNLPLLKLDKTKIQQVFINIFMNAIHSMPEGGTLTVGTYVRRLTEIDYDVGDRTMGRLRVGDTVNFPVGDIAVVAEVEDTGHGIPEDKLAKIFDPFYTTKPAGKGTGLGLTVVKKIIDLHGGSIDIRNRPEGGVLVSVVFKTWRST